MMTANFFKKLSISHTQCTHAHYKISDLGKKEKKKTKIEKSNEKKKKKTK